MNPHPRIRKTIKWGGAAVTVLLAVVWIGTMRWYADWLSARHRIAVSLFAGHIIVSAGEELVTNLDHSGFGFGRSGSWILWAPEWHWGRRQMVMVPLFIPMLASGVAAAIGWRLDTLARRRARVGLCPKCNYDRTGLAAGAVCPECGAPAQIPK